MGGKKPLFEIGEKVECLEGKEKGRFGRVTGFYETLGLDYPPQSDFMYQVEFESDAHGWCRWARLLGFDEIRKAPKGGSS